MSSLEEIRDALLWAAGAPGEPQWESLDVDETMIALRAHRLEGRLLSRARVQGVSLPPALDDRVRAEHHGIVARVHGQMALFRTVRDSVRDADGRPGLVPVKGFSLYALTQRPEHAAYSGDVDVLGADPHAIATAIEATGGVGYHFHGEEHPYVFAHMDDFEVHTRYIITGMPRSATLAVGSGPGRGTVEIDVPFSITSVWYDDITDLLAPGVGEAEGIDVLCPELAILIRCAHVYVGFAMNTQPKPYATVPLEELAQMRDYLQWDAFDAERFLELHERYDAGLVTDFARRLHLDLLGEDPYAKVFGSDAPIRESFPRNLWWDGIDAGFPVDLPWDARSLVAASADQVDLADFLGPSEVALDPAGSATVSFDMPDPDDARPYVFHRYGGGLAFVHLTLAETPDGLRTTVHLPPVADGDMAAIGWETGSFRYELFYRPREGTHDFADYSSDRAAEPPRVESCTSGPEGVALTMHLPWAALGRSGPLRGGAALPVTFRARTQERPWGIARGGLVAPLRVRG